MLTATPAGMDLILCADSPGEQRTARLRGGVLAEYYLHRPAAPDLFGALFWARVTARVPAMAGAFVALPEAEAFLPDTDGAIGLAEGDHLVVRIVRAAQGGKGPRVTAKLNDSERAQAVPGKIRLLAPGPTPFEELRAAFPAAECRHGAFDDAVESEIDAVGTADFALPGGMRGTATPTPALTAIDLDGGTTSSDRRAKALVQLAANQAALAELARQVALRNLSGAILIDFAGLPAKRRAGLADPLRAALAADRLHPRLAGFSTLGFAEILRPRQRPPLHELLASPRGAGLAALRRAAAEAAAAPARRLALRAARPVIAALQADPVALASFARGSTYPLELRPDPTLRGLTWLIEDAA